MVELRLTISDPKSGRSFKKVLSDGNDFTGKKIGEVFAGDVVGLKGFEFQITGGSDSSGFPMRTDLPGTVKRKILLVRGLGLHTIKRRGNRKGNAKREGIRKRKTQRGNTVGTDIAQINAKILKGEGIEKFFVSEKKEEKKEE